MRRKKVKSTNLKSVGYDSSSHTLEIEFRSGDVYHYTGVPAGAHLALLSAPSVGRYHAQFIKGHFDYRKLSKEELALDTEAASG